MSWITDLAGKAENILNKIDQNAASVLKSEIDNKNNDGGIIRDTNNSSKTEESVVEGLRRNLSSSSLSLTKSLSPKKLLKAIDIQRTVTNDEISLKTEKSSSSRLSSRRSSISSRADGTIIECEIPVENSSSLNKQVNDYNIEKEMSELRINLAEMTSERNDLKDEVLQLQQEIKEATGLIRIQELENLVMELQNERENLSVEVNEMKNNCMEYVKSITELETNLSKARQTILELSEKLEWQIKESKQHSTEFEQYRKKAQATLQMKDKIIAELRGKNDQNDEFLESDTEKILRMEVDGMRQENSNLNEELKLSHNQVEEMKKMLQQMENKFTENSKEHIRVEELLREMLNQEQQKALQFESDIKVLNQELIAVRDEMYNQRQLFSVKLHEKENEIVKLQQAKQAQQDGYNGFSEENILEDRIQSLTQALVQKQNAIETITAERNALKLQLERTEDKVRQMIIQGKMNNSQVINVNDTDDAKAQLPYLMRENPFDTNVTRRVKRAYSSLDSAGIRIGVFLRRYPLVRIMVFIYVAVLHLWVMFVLLSSTPT